MDTMEKLGRGGIVPVVVIENADNAVDTADALKAGGIHSMEITLRTEDALDAINKVAEDRPDMLVGAGTVLNLEQAKLSVDAGAKFIVSPGFDEDVVRFCVEKNVAVTPGCVTPTEIMRAVKLGCKVLKFFPANVYGGLNALKALAGPFGGVKFIPTGGVNTENIGQFVNAPFVYAVGGSWVCPKADINAKSFEKITALCKEAVKAALGFEIAHVGINTPDAAASLNVATSLADALGMDLKHGNSSNFVGTAVEVMKKMYLGANGHIAVRTNNVEIACGYLGEKGLEVDMDTAKYKNGNLTAVYLKDSFGGFAVHLVRK